MSTLKDLIGHTLGIEESWQRERPDLDLGDFLLAIYIMRLGRILDDAYDKICRKRFGISGADMRVLFALRRAGKPYLRRPTALFSALLVTSGAMTKQVDRLAELQLVERLPGPRKTGGVQLTAKGLKVANAATDIMAQQSPIHAGVAHLSAAQRSNGERFVREILQALEAAEVEAQSNITAPKRTPSKRRART
jgi:DNA-binding MarR family transcriptional regulator